MKLNKDLQEKISLLPLTSGVYKFYDSSHTLLYIGKAHNLKSRVSSYFSSDHFDRPRMIGMIPLIHDLEITQTDNDIEALVLESALIKKFLPKFNSDLKDDKSYAWLYITTKDKYPTVKIVRTVNKKEFTRGQLFGPYPSGTAIKRVFNYLRKLYPFCTAKDPTKPCFYSRIGLCPGPDASIEEYRNNINGIIKFLKGNNKNHLKDLEKQMIVYSAKQEYEKAADLRDKINDLKYLGSEIKFTYFNSEQEYIVKREDRIRESLNKLEVEVGFENLARIECYDISNIQGQMSYGSMTVALNGISTNSHYRIFKIKQDGKPEDPQMLKEVLTRRLLHIGNDKDESLSSKPNLLLIDGGISQLSFIKSIIPSDIHLMGISKGKRLKRKGDKKIDEFWKVEDGMIERVNIKNREIFVNLRDEAHRFALLHHRKLRKFVQKKSVLDEIEGIGLKRKKELLKRFGNIDGIKKASEEELYEVVKNMNVVENIMNLNEKERVQS